VAARVCDDDTTIAESEGVAEPGEEIAGADVEARRAVDSPAVAIRPLWRAILDDAHAGAVAHRVAPVLRPAAAGRNECRDGDEGSAVGRHRFKMCGVAPGVHSSPP
jgi:hypothetical protein